MDAIYLVITKFIIPTLHFQFAREILEGGDILLMEIGTNENHADIMMKVVLEVNF